jgi:hypothetical protein
MRFRARSSIAAVVAISLSICLAATALGARGWTGPTALSNDSVTGLFSLHSLASDGSRLHLFYARSDLQGVSGGSLLYRRSLDAGRTWEPERVLFAANDRLTEAISNISMTARGDVVVALFRTHTARNALLFARTSHDGGTTWGPRVRIDAVATDLEMGISSVTISDARILVAWTVRTTGHIYTSFSTDGGQTFSQRNLVASTSYDFACGNPDYRDGMVSLGSGGKSVELAWSDGRNAQCAADQLFVRHSTDGGLTWKPRQLVPTVAGGTFGWPEIAILGKSVLLLLKPQASGQLLLRSGDGGVSFDAQLLDTTQGTGQGDVAFAPDGHAMVTMPEVTLSDTGVVTSSRLFTMSSNDRGATWLAPRLAQAMAAAGISTPNLAFAGDTPVVAFVVWTDPPYANDVFVTTGTGDRTQP